MKSQLVRTDSNKHSYVVDLETFIAEHKKPVSDLFSSSLLSFDILEFVQKSIDQHPANSGHTERSQAVKAFYLDD